MNISDNSLCAPGARALARAFRDNQIMTELNVSNNSLGFNYKTDMSGVKALASIVPTMGALKSLNISGNKIDSEGAKALTNALKANSFITKLNITNNPLGVAAASAMVVAAAKLDEFSFVFDLDGGGSTAVPAGELPADYRLDESQLKDSDSQALLSQLTQLHTHKQGVSKRAGTPPNAEEQALELAAEVAELKARNAELAEAARSAEARAAALAAENSRLRGERGGLGAAS